MDGIIKTLAKLVKGFLKQPCLFAQLFATNRWILAKIRKILLAAPTLLTKR
jgi:hypothetical protein